MSTPELLEIAYAPLIDLADHVDEATGWTPTRLPGWTVRDLLFHLASDTQRALVALFTPAHGDPDTDDVTYWSGWRPGTDGAQAGLRGTRTMASAWSSVRGPADLYAETARATLRAIGGADPDAVVRTQGHTLTVRSLISTLAVEATVHHLDLDATMRNPPRPAALAETRRVLDRLLGDPAPREWDDVRYIKLGTGRAQPTAAERRALGSRAERLPLFG